MGRAAPRRRVPRRASQGPRRRHDLHSGPAHPPVRRGAARLRRALGPARSRHRDPRADRLWTASHDEIAAYLRSVFQADGYVSVRRENGCENAPRRLRRDRRALDRGHPDPARGASASTRGARARPRSAQDRHDMHEVFDLDRLRASALRRARRLRRRAQAGQAARVAGPAQPEALPGPARGGDRRHRAARRDGGLRHPDRVRRVPLQQRRGPQLLHPLRRGLDGVDPRLEHEGGQIFLGGSGLGHQPLEHPLLDRSRSPRAARRRARSRSCAAPTPGRARSSPAARRAARRRWSSSTSTIRTSASSSGARPRRRRRPTRCATPASTCRSTARASSRSSTRTPTTRCA